MNPITTLVRTRMKELNLKRGRMPERLGFQNSSKGLRRLDRFLKTAEGSGQILENLPGALELPENFILAAVAETRSIILNEKNSKARAAFRPHLFAVTERRIPSQITICALTGLHRHRTVNLPDGFNSFSPEMQDGQIRKAIRKNMEKHNGFAPFFGRILRYVLFRDSDESPKSRAVFHTDGEEIKNAPENLRKTPGHTVKLTARVGGRDISGLLSPPKN